MIQALHVWEYIKYLVGKSKPIKSMTVRRALVQSSCRALLAVTAAGAVFSAFDANPKTIPISDFWYLAYILGFLMPFEAMFVTIAQEGLRIQRAVAARQRFNAWVDRAVCRGYLNEANCPKRTISTAYYVELIKDTLAYWLVVFLLFYVLYLLHCGTFNNTPPPLQPQPEQTDKGIAEAANNAIPSANPEISDSVNDVASDNNISEQDANGSSDQIYEDHTAEDDSSEDDSLEDDLSEEDTDDDGILGADYQETARFVMIGMYKFLGFVNDINMSETQSQDDVRKEIARKSIIGTQKLITFLGSGEDTFEETQPEMEERRTQGRLGLFAMPRGGQPSSDAEMEGP